MLFNGSTLPVSSDTIFQIVKLLNHYILHRLILSHDTLKSYVPRRVAVFHCLALS